MTAAMRSSATVRRVTSNGSGPARPRQRPVHLSWNSSSCAAPSRSCSMFAHAPAGTRNDSPATRIVNARPASMHPFALSSRPGDVGSHWSNELCPCARRRCAHGVWNTSKPAA